MVKLQLGKTKEKTLELSPKTLQRHFACFGSSGSGKTVACKVMIEELARNGIPVIAFDPQGDIASLALTEEAEVVAEKGTDAQILKSFTENTEVVIWTPGSSKGLPISINPLQFEGIEALDSEDQLRFFSSTAKNISGLLGYNLENDDGKSAEAVLAVIFEYSFQQKIQMKDFSDVIEILNEIPEDIADTINTVANTSFLQGLIKKLSLLTLGSRKLIFQTGIPANIDTLLGLDCPEGKTRISIIYLNTLSTAEEKEFFISSICQLLYNWMLKNPPPEDFESIQCELLFRQGRKYGVSCIIATQSPGDIDYKAIGQFSTFTLGTLNTKQDIEKVKRRMESIAPTEIDFIVKKMPSLKPGQFLLASPDEFNKVQSFQVRWLVTKHPLVISEDKLAELTSGQWREKYKEHPTDSETSAAQPEVAADKNKSCEEVLLVKNVVLERELQKRIKPYLDGGMIKSEVLDDVKFQHIPLIKVDLVVLQERGMFKKKTVEVPENLYLDFQTKDLLFVKKNKIMFTGVLDIDPDKIDDIDDFCTLESVPKSEVDFDFRTLGGKKPNFVEIKNMMERKYRVSVRAVDMVLFPVWQCQVSHKKGNGKRTILLDGVFGNEISKDK
jgi:hypothetical protein